MWFLLFQFFIKNRAVSKSARNAVRLSTIEPAPSLKMEQGNNIHQYTMLFQFKPCYWLVVADTCVIYLLHIDLELFITDEALPEVRFSPAAIVSKRVDSTKAEKPVPRSKFFNMQEGKVLHYSYSIDA